MRLLLDTHIWIWSLVNPERLTRRVAAVLESSANELWLSPISTWEFLVLAEKGRLAVAKDPFRWLAEDAARVSLREAPITHAVARESRRVPFPHQDPADRFLVATARVYELTLVTADQKLIRQKPCPILANR